MNNEELRKEQKEEAIKRIKELTKVYNLDSSMLDSFNSNHVLGNDTIERERTPEEKEHYIQLMNDFMEKHNAIIYYYVLSNIKYDNQTLETLNIFYVGQYKEDWENVKTPENDEVYVYSYNLTIPDYSEFGYIGVGVDKDNNLTRTY